MRLDVSQIGAEAIKQGLDASVKAFGLELRGKMRQATGLLRNEVRANIRRQFTRGKGKLVGSIRSSVKGTPANLEGRVFIGGRRAYYAIHETGGVIRPKARGARAQRNAAGRIAQGKARRRDTQALLVFGIVRGGNFFGWVSVPQVTIPARPFMGPAVDAKGDAATAIVGDAFGIYRT